MTPRGGMVGEERGRRLVYLHGFASGPGSTKARLYREAFGSLDWRVDVPDLNPLDFRDLTVGGMLDRAEAVIRSAPGPVGLVGSSLGGYLASCLAGRSPQARALVLLAPAFDLRAPWTQRLGPEALRAWQRLGTISIFHHGVKEDRPLDYRFYEESAGYPAFPPIGSVPTLVFHGRHDEVIPVEASERFASGQPNVELRILDDSHDLIESTPQIIEESRRFLETHLTGMME